MRKTIKHMNLLKQKEGFNVDELMKKRFVCRGCTMQNRGELWMGFQSSISDEINRSIDNSYLTLEEEPSNHYDPNAVMVVCRGEFFGTLGYVGKESAVMIKDILNRCAAYRIDVVDESRIGEREIELEISWRKNGEN